MDEYLDTANKIVERCSDEVDCNSCRMLCEDPKYCLARLAAFSIDNLVRQLKECRDELCLHCGNYRMAHEGACDGCKYKDM